MLDMLAQQEAVPAQEIATDAEVLELVEKTYSELKPGRASFEREWYENILFRMGNQWIVWDQAGGSGKFRKQRLKNWVPTPVTNVFAATGQRLVSVLSRIEPNFEFVPQSDRAEDIQAAQMCDSVEDVVCEENKIDSLRQPIASWLTYTGNCYLLSGVDPVYGEAPEPSMLDGMGMEAEMEGLLENLTPEPQIESYKNYTEVLSPFEVWKDHTIEQFENQPKILVVHKKDKEYVKNHYPDIDPDSLEETQGTNYLETIGYLTSDTTANAYLAGNNKIRRVEVKRLFMLPTEKYKNGLYAVVAGGKVCEKKELPLDSSGEPFIPIADMKFDSVPGAAYASTPLTDIKPKQRDLNKVDSLIILIATRMSAPVWLIPEGTVVNNFSGEPGAQLKYNLIGDKASKPDRIPGEQIPTSIMQYRTTITSDIENLGSTFEALKGQAPYSGAPGVVVDQLVEQGMTRFGPSLRNIGEGYRVWMKHQIEFLRAYGQQAERIFAKKGKGTRWTFAKFKGADLMGAINVRVASDSTIPRSSQVENAKIMGAINAKLVDIEDPNVRYEVLKSLGISKLMENADDDVVDAALENEAIERGDPIDVTPFIDNHPILIAGHKAFLRTDRGRQFKDIIVQHITKHMMIGDAEMNSQPMPEQGGKKIDTESEAAMNPGEEVSPPIPEEVIPA